MLAFTTTDDESISLQLELDREFFGGNSHDSETDEIGNIEEEQVIFYMWNDSKLVSTYHY